MLQACKETVVCEGQEAPGGAVRGTDLQYTYNINSIHGVVHVACENMINCQINLHIAYHWILLHTAINP